jgi:hypothetical protein
MVMDEEPSGVFTVKPLPGATDTMALSSGFFSAGDTVGEEDGDETAGAGRGGFAGSAGGAGTSDAGSGAFSIGAVGDDGGMSVAGCDSLAVVSVGAGGSAAALLAIIVSTIAGIKIINIRFIWDSFTR